ncbi:MAG: hypothetical protein ABIO35_08375 [Nitrobacter sp.]
MTALTNDEIEQLAHRIAIDARSQLEAQERTWAYLPSFQDAVAREAKRTIELVLLHERRSHGQSSLTDPKTDGVSASVPNTSKEN